MHHQKPHLSWRIGFYTVRVVHTDWVEQNTWSDNFLVSVECNTNRPTVVYRASHRSGTSLYWIVFCVWKPWFQCPHKETRRGAINQMTQLFSKLNRL